MSKELRYTMTRQVAVSVALLFSILLVPAGMAQDPADAKRVGPGLRIGPEDTISIYALGAEEISKNWRVGATGDIALPMLGQIHVAGLTVEELEQLLTKRLKQYLKEPHVSVYIAEFRSQPVTVIGAVVRPGTLQMENSKTLFDLIVRAGGPNQAGPTITVTRNLAVGAIPYPGAHPSPDGKYSVVDLDLNEVMEGRTAAANLSILPQDVVAVSEKKQPRLVHIAGEVNRPGSVELVTQESVSLMKVLALAGGLTRTAQSNKAIISHVNAAGAETSRAIIDINKTLSGRAKDLELVAGDIVYVPSNKMTNYIQTATSSAITAGIFSLGRF